MSDLKEYQKWKAREEIAICLVYASTMVGIAGLFFFLFFDFPWTVLTAYAILTVSIVVDGYCNYVLRRIIRTGI